MEYLAAALGSKSGRAWGSERALLGNVRHNLCWRDGVLRT